MQAVADDDVHQAQGKGNVGTGIDRNVPIGEVCGARAIRIDHYQSGPIAPRLVDERPQMNVVAVNVRGPGDDVLRVAELFGLGPNLRSAERDNGVATRL